MRNDMVFNNKEFDLRQLLENIKLRIASWYKANWSSCNESVCNLVRFPNLIKAPLKANAVRILGCGFLHRVVFWNLMLMDPL